MGYCQAFFINKIMENTIKIHTFENYKYDNPFNILNFVEFTYYNNYNDVFQEDNRLCLVNVDDIYDMYGIVVLIYNFLERNCSNKVIFSRYRESSVNVLKIFKEYNFEKFIDTQQISMLISAEFEHPKFKFCNVDFFPTAICNNDNINISLRFFDNIFEKENKPYKFLCLNGKDREHRIDLYNKLNEKNLIKNSLFSMTRSKFLPMINLPNDYQDYFNNDNFSVEYGSKKVKRHEWIEGLLNPKLYVDTYFSVITETHCYETIYPFITEKTCKPLLMGHPFLILSTPNFYKHLKNLGYITFENLIDEGFDEILDNKKRIEYFVKSVENLCNSNLTEFLKKARPICEYNREMFMVNAAKIHLKNYRSISSFIKNI
jgi:hypothetical protein